MVSKPGAKDSRVRSGACCSADFSNDYFVKMTMTSSLGPVLEHIFKSLYEAGAHTLIFDVEMFDVEARRLGKIISALP